MKGIKKGLAILLVLCTLLSMVVMTGAGTAPDDGAQVLSLTMGTKPADGTTTGNPFEKGTGGSNSFRIPAMVTLNNGTIVAAADARWNTTFDGGGLDTIVSYSTDNGASWNYTFANYLGDNGNTYNGSGSTAFIDPALATDGSTVYMLCDLYPYGVALNGSGNTPPSAAVGFNSDGTLKLAANGSSTYDYYLKDGQIYDSSNNVVSGYTVDAYFNIKGNDCDTNLFFSDSPFKVVRTGYLYLTKSTDGGKTWSAPTLIPNVKTASEQVCLVGPGRGLVTDGKIIFPVYSYNGSSSSQQMGFIYSSDGGVTWTRSANFEGDSWSSESAVVALNDGTLRFFYRNGNSKLYYADYIWNNGWGNAVNTGIATNSNTQISAISYSKPVDGKQVILVSCPTGNNNAGSADSSARARLNGKIFVGYVNSDNTMSWQNDKAISVTSNNSQFMYSCLTELNDGKVAILYENQESGWGTGDNYYYTMDFQTYDLNLTSGGDSGNTGTDVTDTQNITLTVGESASYDVSTSEVTKASNSAIATAEIVTNSANTYQKVSEITSGKQYLMAVNTSHVLTTMSASNSWSINGFTTANQTVTNEIISSDLSAYLWQVTKTTDGYTFKNADGKYLAIDESGAQVKNWGTNYPLKVQDEAYTFTIDVSTGAVGNATLGAYLNNYSSSNACVAGYKGNSGTSYSEITFYEAQSEYSLTITGVSAGTTSVTVGSTQYNITVNRKTQDVGLSVAGTATYTDSSSGTPVVQDSTVATATLSNGQLTIKGLKDGTTTVTTDTTVYTVTVSEGIPISIEENETATISVPLSDGQYVEWTSAGNNYVGVAGKYDTTAGAYTNEAILAGQNVTDSPVVVTGTVYNADGTVAGTHKWLVTVTEGDADTNTSSKGIYFNIDTIENCTVYYSINGGELIPVNGTGVDTGIWTENGTYTGHFNIMFFAAPDEGYALTYMSISGSADQYYTLSNGNPDGTGSDAWPFNDANASTIPSSGNDSAWKTVNGSLHGFRWSLLEGNMTIDQMKVMFSNAIALGCDGATTITKNSTSGMGSASSPIACKFVAQKLPTVEKTIESITHNGTETPYTDGMKVALGDTIHYKVVATRYATNETYGTITYDNEKLTDKLTKNDGIRNPDMGTSTTSNKTYTYTTNLTVTMANYADVVQDGKITNTVDFSYSYSSSYSRGSLTSEASAVADITIQQPEYVIDFGLPVTMDLKTELSGTTISSGTAKYGTITANGTSFTYTPTQTLKGTEYVVLTLANGGSFGVTIYPATTVYYEETFIDQNDRFDGFELSGTSNVATQTASVVGSKAHYGYDDAYSTANGASGGTEYHSASTGSTAKFFFTGTGVDVYANCTPYTGAMMMRLMQKNNNGGWDFVQLYSVDTKMANGTTNATTGQNVKAYNVPVVSISDLPYGEYSLWISHVKAGSEEASRKDGLNLDGFRVYGTLDYEGSTAHGTVYKADLEDNPIFIELRDRVLATLGATADKSAQYADQIAANAYSQVYATANGNTNGAIILSANASYNNAQLQDLLDNGPKNEIYLQPQQALTFKINTKREVQIGLKALNAATSYKINDTEQTLNASTDMFYTVLNKAETASEKTITITNTGTGILSITDLKVCDDPNATLGELTAEDLIPALVSLGFEAEPVEADATLNITVQAGDKTLTVQLTASGIEGESHTFTAAEIQAAVEALELPEGYTLDGVTFEDVTVTCGEASDVSFTASEIPAPAPASPIQKVFQIFVKIVKKIFSRF